MKRISLFYVTFADNKTAADFGRKVIEKRLAACYNLLEMNSCFWWDGHIEENSEVIAIFKTTIEKEDQIRSWISENHPYEVPCILNFQVESNNSYYEWIRSETNMVN